MATLKMTPLVILLLAGQALTGAMVIAITALHIMDTAMVVGTMVMVINTAVNAVAMVVQQAEPIVIKDVKHGT